MGVNCQDAVGMTNGVKIVCDGCSEGKHSEVGAWLFVRKTLNNTEDYCDKAHGIEYLADTMLDVQSNICTHTWYGDDPNPQLIKDYLCYTILMSVKVMHEQFITYVCGDGYIILQKDGDIRFVKVDNGEYPKYFSYNYIDSSKLKHYKDGVEFDVSEWEGYENVGIASDGIRFVADLPEEHPLKKEFKSILLSGKELKMKLFINRHEKLFQDDVSIVF